MSSPAVDRFLGGVRCEATRRVLGRTIATYCHFMDFVPRLRLSHVVECGPGTLSMVAMALSALRSEALFAYIGLERDPVAADKLREFLGEHELGGEVKAASMFSLAIDLALPDKVAVFCFEHSLEDILLGMVGEVLGVSDISFAAVVDILSAKMSELGIGDHVPLYLSSIFGAIETLSAPDTICIVHHFCSPRYKDASNLYLLDQIIAKTARSMLCIRYRTLVCFRPQLELAEEFWWVGYIGNVAPNFSFASDTSRRLCQAAGPGESTS